MAWYVNHIVPGYRSEIDKFFLERLYDPSAQRPLKQDTPARIQEIISILSEGATPGRVALSGYLLDLDGDTRRLISDCINQELATQSTTRRPKPYSSHGGVAFTIFCYAQPWTQRNSNIALDHVRTVLLVNDDERRLLLELSYTERGALAGLHWQWVKLANIPPQELPRLKRAADKLRKTRVANAKALRKKIGRNELCPCGSGKKYKKCCLVR